MKNTILSLFIVLYVLFIGSCTKKRVTKKPNIVFIMTDDMGYETLSCNGAVNYDTPNLDRLASESYIFTNCDSQPLCCPTRIKLVTGQYNYRNYKGWGSFDLEYPAIGKVIQRAGYATAVFGKWHMNKSPEELGFDEHCIFTGSPDELPYAEFFKRYYYNCPVIEDGKDTVVAYAPDKFNRRALQFIEKNRDNPFFLYYPLSLSHNPFEPIPDSENPDSRNWQDNFEDMVAYSDKMIGRVIKKLKEEDLYENTIIFYTSDNGTKTLAHEMSGGEVIYGGKGTQRVDGVHVPLFVKYDGTHKILDDLVDFSDFYPTIASIGGITKQELSNRMDGVSFHPLLKGEQREPKPYIFSVFFHPLNAYIRGKEFKYYLDGRLYNINRDPRELHPFYSRSDSPETARKREKLKTWLAELLEGSQFSEYSTKDQLLKTFEDYRSDKDNHWLLSSFIFDSLEYVPRSETLLLNLTDFLDKNLELYSLRFSREHRSRNSGLTYADAVINSVGIFQGGDTLLTKNFEEMELTTRHNVDMLRTRGNPIISFTREGDDSKVSLGKLALNKSETVRLEVDVALSNPANQWGDRIMLYVYLDKEEKEE